MSAGSGARPLGSIRPAGDGVWRVQVSAGVDPVTGRRIRRVRRVHGTYADAQRVHAQLLLESGSTPPSRLTVAEYLYGAWLPHVEQTVRARTADGYREKIRNVIVPGIGGRRLDQLTPMHLDRWLATAVAEGRTPSNVAGAWRVARAALRQAHRWRMIATDPTVGVSPPRPAEPHRPQVASLEHATAIVDAFVGHRLEPAVALALGGGLRRSEVCGMRWGDVDLDAGTVTVRRGLHERRGSAHHVEPPKTDRSRRTVHLPRWAIDGLARGRDAIGAAPHPDRHVVASRTGGPLTPSAMSRLYLARLDECGIPRVPFRDLRHTHATLQLAGGVDVVIVSRRLGHSNVGTTDRFYLRPDAATDRAAAQVLGGLGTVRHRDVLQRRH